MNLPEGLIVDTGGQEFLAMVDAHATDGMTAWRSPSVKRQAGSAIEGVGLFALQDIAPQSLLAIKQGAIRTEAAVKRMAGIIKGSHQQIGSDVFLTGTTPQQVKRNLVGYNHSCEPNARVALVRGFPLALLVSRNEIEAGSEITTDYSVSYTSETQSIADCQCGSRDCRGVIDPTKDWKNPAFQRKYEGEFPEWLQRKITWLGDATRLDSIVSSILDQPSN